MNKKNLITFLLIILLFPLQLFAADPQADLGIPAELQNWTGWINAKHPEWKCAKVSKAYECLWPGSIVYLVSEKKAKFLIKAQFLAKDQLELPSSDNLSPANLTVKDQVNQIIFPPIRKEDGKIFVNLEPGDYSVEGDFNWDEIPSEIPVPESYGMYEVKFEGENGSKLDFVRLGNAIRFQNREKTDRTSSINLKVFRKFLDASPIIVESLLRVQISGGARSYNVGQFLPKHSHLIEVDSELPYQIGSDGALSLQLLPGQYDLKFTSVIAQPVNSIELPAFNADVWPKEETWSWNANNPLRSVEVEGARATEASLTELPDEWKNAATYVVASDSKVTLSEIRRGKEPKPFSNLRLQRSLWIDLDGTGYTVSDTFSGELQQISRLNALKETELGRATLNGNQQLITLDPQNNLAGVEVRDTSISLNAVSRLAKSKTISAVGWDTNVDSLNLNLSLPPSWMLFATLNTSYAESSWFESWTLFEVFILILIVIATYKIFGAPLAVLVGLAGVVNYNEFLAPNLLIIHIIILEVCRRLVKDKGSFFYKLFNWLLIATYALWALATITFTKLQFTQLLFPQLQAGTRYRTILQDLLLALENSLFSWPMLLVILAIAIYGVHRFLAAQGFWKKIFTGMAFGVLFLIAIPMFVGTFQYTEYSRSGSPLAKAPSSYLNTMRSYEMADQPADAGGEFQAQILDNKMRVFQSGPATPDWKWRTHDITVNGPVSAKHEITIFLLSPSVTRTLAAVRCLVAFFLILFMFKALSFKINSRVVNTLASIFLFSLFPFCLQNANAETPPKEILEEMEQRLADKQCDSEKCATIRDLRIDLTNDSLSMYFDISSEGQSSIFIPGPSSTFHVKKIVLNGKETIALRNSAENYLEVKTLPGNNRLEIQGDLPDSLSFALEFAEKAIHTTVNAPGWYVEGISAEGMIQRGLHFTKEENGSKKIKPTEVRNSHTSWVIAKRSFLISESVSVSTNLERIGDVSAPLKVELPLMPGEIVTNKDSAKEGDKLIVYIPAGERNYAITSNIALPASLELEAKSSNLISEEWNVFCESFVACVFSGLNPTATDYHLKNKYLWHPFPGEKVSVGIKTLGLAAGEYLTIDKLFHNVNWGSSRISGNLQINLRATKQLSFEVAFKGQEKIENVLVDRIPGTSKVSESTVSVLLSPGNHDLTISYAKEWQPQYIEYMPVFSANADLHNLNFTINPSAERWVVWTGGGFWGPSVVFWAKILMLIFLIFLMVKLELLQMSLPSVVLLALGLSTLPIILLCIPLFWLVALNYIPVYQDRYLPNWKVAKAVVFWGLSLLSLTILYHLVRNGLVLEPPMLIVGNNSSYYSLRWFFDHSGKESPAPWVISFPIWYWRAIALAWSGWFVFKLFEWLKEMVEVGRGLIK